MDEETYKQNMLDKLKATYMNRQDYTAVFISATKRENISELRDLLVQKVSDRHLQIYPNYLKDRDGGLDYDFLFKD
jgi:GTP-binding protein HflX